MALVPEHLERMSWSRDRILEERERGLRGLLQVAVERSAWHRERLAGVDPERIREQDLARLPVMTKDDLMANWDAIVTDPRLSLALVEEHLEGVTDDAYLLDHYHAVASGGSSGRRGVFIYGWEAWALGYLGFVRMGLWERVVDPQLAGVPVLVATVAAATRQWRQGALR